MTSSHTQTPQQIPSNPSGSGAWDVLSAMLPTADWTAESQAGRLTPLISDRAFLRSRAATLESNVDAPSHLTDEEDETDLYERMARVMYRRAQRHLLITGDKGVGKTAAVRELARRAALGELPFLADKRFLWIDCANVGPEDSRACLETIARVAQTPPQVNTIPHANDWNETIQGIIDSIWDEDQDDEVSAVPPRQIILCLDGLDALLKRPQGGSNQPLLRAIASRPDIWIIGIMNRWSYNDMVAGDAGMLDLFTRIEIEEPSEETAHAILRQQAGILEQEYGLRIDEAAVEKTISLASSFLLSESHPSKDIKVLRQACDEVHYRITQHSLEKSTISTEDIVRVVSNLTDVPVATLQGEAGDADFEALLSAAVVGQPRAVQAAATELRLIKAGLSEPGKPASVLLFAGMTGVGKTELAKRIAELYSTSRRLCTYSMGNFTEPHSVSGIIGVPPGYVGHEEGGRLINELNADPYSVFLLDEAEKCHPNVWKPFLNLFDEGWIVDQRGVKAYADRAIFILTTNAGDRTIAQMSRSDKPEAEIVERVKATLARVRQERSSQPVFTPQLLARIQRTVVFGPLDETAMLGIVRIVLERVQDLWRRKRERELIVSEEIIVDIARRAHARNEKANGEEGGRIVRKLISDQIEHPVQLAATERDQEYRSSHRILIDRDDALALDDPESDSCPVHVQFLSSNGSPAEIVVSASL